MRKPRDFDAELKALEDKARGLKTRKVRQLGELVIATGLTRSAPMNWRAR
jgi:DNA-binding protein H-NS